MTSRNWSIPSGGGPLAGLPSDPYDAEHRASIWLRMRTISALVLLAAGGVLLAAAPARVPQPVTIIFFRPSNLPVPDGVVRRITQIADTTECFLFTEMRRHGYPPAARNLFRRQPDGSVEVLFVRGDHPAARGAYAQPNYAPAVIAQARRESALDPESKVFWIFVYLGDRPVRFEDWRGTGDARNGGWSMVNYDTVKGGIRQDLALTEGFNYEYKMKSTVHELCHALGLPHTGPDPALGLGNSLMGPNPPGYEARNGPRPDHVYMEASSAAMLWKHPIFSGVAMGAPHRSTVKLTDYRAAFDPALNTVTISGRVTGQAAVHSVVVIDSRGERDGYWSRSYAARVAADGRFEIRVSDPAKTNGVYRVLFCFDDGLVSGDGEHGSFDNRGEIHKRYRFVDGTFQFDL